MKSIIIKSKIFTLITLINLALLLCYSTAINATNNHAWVDYLNENAIPVVDENSLTELITNAADNRLVLLGEASHGTSEYYYWRYQISKRLIEEHGFDFILVEGDWPAFFEINRFVKNVDQSNDYISELMKKSFRRWPQWMWANEETEQLINWLRTHNSGKNLPSRVGIYGMDVYSLQESIVIVQEYLRSFDDQEIQDIAELYDVFAQVEYDGSNYARSLYFGGSSYEANVTQVVDFLRANRERLLAVCEIEYFNSMQNSMIVKNAEKHFRTSINQNTDSWNHRVFHMSQTIDKLLDFYGSDSKGIVWAHNTHIGDARATSMSQQGSVNIGQLTRESFDEENVYLVGFGSDRGNVIAGSSWGSPKQIMNLPSGMSSSIEYIFNRADHDDFMILFDSGTRDNELLNEVLGHRAVGVVYNPEREVPGNYVPTILPRRYDAFIFFSETTALSPL